MFFDLANNIFMKKYILSFRVVKFVSLCLALFLVASFIFAGCSVFQEVDKTVDMTPRLIASQENMSTEQVVENVKSAVVGISAHSNSGSSVGSGVAIAPEGYILTNHHVVSGATALLVYYADKQKGMADFVWSDSSLDLAIIKARKDMPYLECGTSADLKVGQDIIAIGTPLTLQFKHTVTKGIVSALNRTLEVGSLQNANYLQNLIQHDASINPGNSGGPLISMNGKVIGINTLKANESEGIGFAIPIEVGKTISERVISNNAFSPAYIGLFGFDSQIAAFYNQTTQEKGVYVLSIDNNSPAEKAGIKEKDVLVAINDKQIDTVLDLRIALYKALPEETLTLKLLRDGVQLFVDVTAKER